VKGDDMAKRKKKSKPKTYRRLTGLRRTAGHAAVYYLCRLPYKYVTIIPDGDAKGHVKARVSGKRLAARAGIDKRVHAHGLRHTHAAQLRAEGVDIAIISRQLGHASITTTARYLDHIAPTAVIEAMRHRRWAGA
jgi:integrase